MKTAGTGDDARPFHVKLWQLVYPYWASDDRRWAGLLLGAIITLNLGLVFLLVLLNEWNRLFYNALEQKNYADFQHLLLRFAVLATCFIIGSVYRIYLTQMLEMRWRVWLTHRYLGLWLRSQAYYRLELLHRETDNPDQRIAEDLQLFTNQTLGLSLGLLSSTVTLASFVAILWTISGSLAFSLGGTSLTIPGYMVWAALAYAIVGSLLTHAIGRPLIALNFHQQRYEADFRFHLIRLRENAEGVALYGAESSEQAALGARFERIRANWWQLMRYTKRLTGFTVGYSQAANIFPFLVAAPRYFAGAITLGGLMQISSAFDRVQGALSWFIDSYGQLAGWRASVDRLLSFEDALERAALETGRGDHIQLVRGAGPTIRAESLELTLPCGRPILSSTSLEIAAGDRILVTGPSGSGKTMLFRALAGIWPFGRGVVRVPATARMLFLPQKPYLPIATLRAVVSYPSESSTFSDADITAALRLVQLERLTADLDVHGNWSLQLSLGEQQRLAVARAFLQRPQWLFLDEATASLDEASETALYEALRTQLPGTTLVSIAHRPALSVFHRTHLTFTPGGEIAQLTTGQLT